MVNGAHTGPSKVVGGREGHLERIGSKSSGEGLEEKGVVVGGQVEPLKTWEKWLSTPSSMWG